MTRSFVQAFGARIFAILASLVCGLVSLKLYGRYISPGAYGVVLVALTITGYLPLLDGGFRTTINRALLAERDSVKRWRLLKFGQVFYSWISVLAVLVSVLLMSGYAASPTGKSSSQPVSFFLALAVTGALSVIASVQSGLLVGLQSQGALFLISGFNSCFNLAGLWISLVLGADVWAFPISTFCGAALTFPLAVWLIKQREPQIELVRFEIDTEFWPYFKRLRGDAWACFRSQMATLILYTVDIILVGFICSPVDAAIYGLLSRIFAILRGLLQSMSEIAWPIIAHRGGNDTQFNHFLNRMNAWSAGSVTGVLSLILGPFCRWYVGESWSAPNYLVWLMAARFLITNLAAPAAYFLYGIGDFRSISRNLQRELIAALALSLILGPAFGLRGVAWSFLASTAFGTLFPIIRIYAGAARESLRGVLTEVWWRAATGFCLSWTCTKLALSYFPRGTQIVLAGGFGLAAGLAGCFLWSAMRMPRPETGVPPDTILKLMKGI